MLHVLYKREAEVKGEDFCGIDNTISSEELMDSEAGVHEDVFVVGQRLSQEGDLVVGGQIDKMIKNKSKRPNWQCLWTSSCGGTSPPNTAL